MNIGLRVTAVTLDDRKFIVSHTVLRVDRMADGGAFLEKLAMVDMLGDIARKMYWHGCVIDGCDIRLERVELDDDQVAP